MRADEKGLPAPQPEEKKSAAGREAKEIQVSESIRDPHLDVAAYASATVPDIKLNYAVLYGTAAVISDFPATAREAGEISQQKTCGVRIPKKFLDVFKKFNPPPKLPQDTDEERKTIVQKLLTLEDCKNDQVELNELLKNIDRDMAFKKQFNVLIDKLFERGQLYGIEDTVLYKKKEDEKDEEVNFTFKDALSLFKEYIFSDGFAGNQHGHYFEILKRKLETFLSILNDKQIEPAKIQNLLLSLAKQLSVCGPGVFSNLDAAINELNPVKGELVSSWLMDFRTTIVLDLAQKYLTKNPIYAGNEKHIGISFNRLGQLLGLNIRSQDHLVKDQHHDLTGLDRNAGKTVLNDFFTNPANPQRQWFEKEFKEDFSPKKIDDNLFFNLMTELTTTANVELTSYNKKEGKRFEKETKEFKAQQRKQQPEPAEVIKVKEEKQGKLWPSKDPIKNALNKILLSIGFSEDQLQAFYQYDDAFEYFSINQEVLREAFLKLLETKHKVFAENMIHKGKMYFYQDYVPQLSSPLDFVYNVHKLGASIAGLEYLPDPVKDEMTLRINALEIEGRTLLNDHIRLKQAVEREEASKIEELIKKPGINLNYKIYEKESLWDSAVRLGNIKACELFLGMKQITKEILNYTFEKAFGDRNSKVFDFLIQKIEKPVIDNLIRNTLRSKNEKECKFLFDKKLITEQQYQSILKEKNEVKTPAPGFFQPKLTPKEQKELNNLLEHVVKGNKDEVKKILDANPKLVLQTGRATDFSGREIEGTVFQMALGADDVNRAKVKLVGKEYKPDLEEKGHIQILHPDEGMAEMIQGYFKKACNDDENAANQEMAEQYKEQFPDDEKYNAAEKKRKDDDLAALTEVINAIDNNDDQANVRFVNGTYDNSQGVIKLDAKCEAALNKFREYLRPKGVITKGKHFNVELLVEAFKLYDEKFEKFGNKWDSPKNVLFWRNVIGYIQRYLPACYAQAFCQSLWEVVDKNNKLRRSLEFQYDRDFFFYPLVAGSGLGYNYAGGDGRRSVVSLDEGDAGVYFTTYIKQKHQSLGAYAAAARQSAAEFPQGDLAARRNNP